MKTSEQIIAKLQRQAERRGRHILGLMDAADKKDHEIKKLEEVLVWIHRTGQPIEEIRMVIEKTIPRRLRRETDPA